MGGNDLVFRSFFLGGFECATGFNRHGEWIDQVAATKHDLHVDEDYRRLREVGIAAAREAIRWPLVDLGRGRYDFSSVAPFLRSSREHGVEVIWDLFHYGYPQGVDLFAAEFPHRFADYCYAAARYVAARTDGRCYFTPVNEPSFFAYSGGERGLFAPYCQGRGWELKVSLVRAAIAGIDAIRAACPGARMVNADPLCHVAAHPGAPAEEVEEARDFNDRLVFQTWDMLCGRLLPELGGSREHLDIIGINYYWTNQWEWRIPLVNGIVPPLEDDDPRRLSLSELVRRVWRRYGGELMISETSHVGDRRASWLREVAHECEALLAEGMPLRGICLYPILGMPEWHAQDEWTSMGLWDPHHADCPGGDPCDCPARVRCETMLEALQEAQRLEVVYATPGLEAELELQPA
jgi:hypothetical protein